MSTPSKAGSTKLYRMSLYDTALQFLRGIRFEHDNAAEHKSTGPWALANLELKMIVMLGILPLVMKQIFIANHGTFLGLTRVQGSIKIFKHSLEHVTKIWQISV